MAFVAYLTMVITHFHDVPNRSPPAGKQKQNIFRFKEVPRLKFSPVASGHTLSSSVLTIYLSAFEEWRQRGFKFKVRTDTHTDTTVF